MLEDLPEAGVALPPLFSGEALGGDGVTMGADVKRRAVCLVVHRLGCRGVASLLCSMEALADHRGAEPAPHGSWRCGKPFVDVSWADGEVEQQVLDLHDVAHRVDGNGQVARQGRFGRGLEVGCAARDQERQSGQHGISLEASGECIEAAKQRIKTLEASAVQQRSGLVGSLLLSSLKGRRRSRFALRRSPTNWCSPMFAGWRPPTTSVSGASTRTCATLPPTAARWARSDLPGHLR